MNDRALYDPTVKLPPGRVPPQALEAETSLLGAMLIERDAVAKVAEILPRGCMYAAKHEAIYEAILDLFARNAPVDLVTVGDELGRTGKLAEVGGALYLTELTMQMASAANAEYHALLVHEAAKARQFITEMTSLVSRAYDREDIFDLCSEAEAKAFAIADTHLIRSSIGMRESLRETMNRLEAIAGMEGGITGIPSGFRAVDDLTAGWQKAELIVIAARPSHGKTAFGLSCARNAALHPTDPVAVGYFSLEMPHTQLTQRLLAAEARVDAQRARTGRLTDADWQQIARVADRLAAAPITIDDTSNLSVMELRAKARRMKAEQDVGLIIVDYLQLMTAGGELRSGANREQEIAYISRSLKGLAKELDIPVLALCQLSRAVEIRGGGKRPQLSDLRESGAIENDADTVAFIHRAEQYGILEDEHGNSTEGMADIIIGKQRNGPIGDVQLAYVKQYAKFENLTTYRSGDEDRYSTGDLF